MVKKPDSEKNKWFTSEKEVYEINERVTAGNMGQVIDKVRSNQQALVKHSDDVCYILTIIQIIIFTMTMMTSRM